MKILKRELDINVDLLNDEEVMELVQKWNVNHFDWAEREFHLRDYEYKPLINLIEDLNGFLKSNGFDRTDDVCIGDAYTDTGYSRFEVRGRKNFPISKIREELKQWIVDRIEIIDKKNKKEKEEQKKNKERKFELYQKLKAEFEKE